MLCVGRKEDELPRSWASIHPAHPVPVMAIVGFVFVDVSLGEFRVEFVEVEVEVEEGRFEGVWAA